MAYASWRSNNPGAMYPGAAAKMFGTTGTESLMGGKYKIALFPTPVHGAAANMELLRRSYVGMTVRDAMKKWSGGFRDIPGPGGNYDPNMVITKEMTQDPSFMVPFMKAIASGEAPGNYPMTDDQWQQAFKWYSQGSVPSSEIAVGSGTTTVPTLPGQEKTPDKTLLAGTSAAPAPATTDQTTIDKIKEMNTLIAMQRQQDQQQQQVAPGITSGPAIGSLLSEIYKGGQQAGWWPAPRAQLVKNPTV
jgi:hypothetical protein